MMGRRGHGEGTVYQRSDGRWTAQLSVPGAGRKTYYGKTQREVQLKLLEARRALQRGVLATGPSQTVEQYLQRWLRDAVRPSVRPRTFDIYGLDVRRVAPYLGRIRLEALKPADVQAAYSTLLERGLSARTVEQVHAVLHTALEQAVKWGLVGRNATDAVSPPRPKPFEMRTLSEEEVQRLFAATAEDRLHALWVLLTTSGIRLGEALGLKWDDLDPKTGRLVIRRSLQPQKGKGLVLAEPKTDKSRRTVHLAPGTVDALIAHRRRQALEQLASGADWHATGLVFTGTKGKPLQTSNMTPAFRRGLAKAGLPVIRIHDLRHTAATLLLARGVHPKVVQELLGHSTISLTLDTYSHVMPALHAEVAAHMQTLFATPARSS